MNTEKKGKKHRNNLARFAWHEAYSVARLIFGFDSAPQPIRQHGLRLLRAMRTRHGLHVGYAAWFTCISRFNAQDKRRSRAGRALAGPVRSARLPG